MPKIAILPLNVGESTRPALGRQFANFVNEAFRSQEDIETQYVTYLARVGTAIDPQAAFVNLAHELNEPKFVQEVMKQSESDYAVDGLLNEEEGAYQITVRAFEKGKEEAASFHREFRLPEIFEAVKWMVSKAGEAVGVSLPAEFLDEMEFGTDDPEAFREFLLGYDAVAYIQRAGGRVAKEFDLGVAFDSLISAVERDPDFLGPYEAGVQLAKLSIEHRVGSAKVVEERLHKFIELVPEDWRALYTLGELYERGGGFDKAAEQFEKAIRLNEAERKRAEEADEEPPPLEPALYTHLGLAQQGMGMVVNAERSLQKAVELEGPEKPSLDPLAQLLIQTKRAHEVPALLKEALDNNLDSPHLWARYAVSLMQNKREEEGMKAFEEGLERSGGNVFVKRYCAPFLATKGELDRAMDFYEDCIEASPQDIALLMEYAQTLAKADREHEIPDVLNSVLAANPEPDMKAQVLAWQYELEQPRRVEAVKRAQELVDKEDFTAAIAELEPIVEWMHDYWKPWALLSSLYNRLQRFEQAEKAARQVIEIFPGCEPAYAELATAQMGQGRHDDAYTVLSMVLRGSPQSVPIDLNLPIAAKRTGRDDEAQRLANQVRDAAGPGNIEIEKALSQIEGL